eukprot:6289908-Karenia_brevis.AAC.1
MPEFSPRLRVLCHHLRRHRFGLGTRCRHLYGCQRKDSDLHLMQVLRLLLPCSRTQAMSMVLFNALCTVR